MDAPGPKPVPAAVERFPCRACGAECRFDPDASALVCEHCGAREEVAREDREIVEYDLETALARAPRSVRRAEAREVSCTSCGARVEVAASETARRCGFCDQPVVLAEDDPDRIAPGSVLPFAVDRDVARRNLRAWLARKWFRPGDLAREAEVERLRGLYVPAWTYDAQTDSFWTAMAGYYYHVTETYSAFENGKSVTKTRQVRKIRWVPAAGRYDKRFDDWLVYGTRAIAPKLLDDLGRWRLAALEPYAPGFLAGYEAQRYSVDLREGWEEARRGVAAEIRSACAARVPGDTHTDLRVRTTYRDLRWKHLLLPLWVVAYRYRGKPYRIVVNGQSGAVDGEAPLSWAKILGLMLVVLLVAAGIALFFAVRGP